MVLASVNWENRDWLEDQLSNAYTWFDMMAHGGKAYLVTEVIFHTGKAPMLLAVIRVEGQPAWRWELPGSGRAGVYVCQRQSQRRDLVSV